MTLIQMKSFTQFLTRCVSISAAEESQGSDTIVECHHNDISSVCDLLSVVQVVAQEVWTLTITKQEATTIDEHHNRQICRHCKGEGVKPHRVNDDRIVIFECTILLTYFFVLFCELEQVCITSSALRDPDVQVETVFTAHNISSENIELHADLSVVGGFQNTCAGRVSSALSIHSLILNI